MFIGFYPIKIKQKNNFYIIIIIYYIIIIRDIIKNTNVYYTRTFVTGKVIVITLTVDVYLLL